MDAALIRRNRSARDTCARSLPLCETWGHDGFLHVCFASVGCRFREAGYCTVCDYGGSRNITEDEAASGLRQALSAAPSTVAEILLGSCGSILDEREMSFHVLHTILNIVHETRIPTVILETHYVTVTDQMLTRISELLPDREVVIELGLESADPQVLDRSLGKYMDLSALSETVQRIRRYGMYPVLNVFLGAPFLEPEEQIQDAQKAAAWAVGHGASRVVLFPANIKPNTLLWELWQEGRYRRISHWMLIELLSRLDDNLLGRVDLSWYGDRQKAGMHTYAIPPMSCPQCGPELMAFYRQFRRDFDPEHRRTLLEQLISSCSCACREEFLAELRNKTKERET